MKKELAEEIAQEINWDEVAEIVANKIEQKKNIKLKDKISPELRLILSNTDLWGYIISIFVIGIGAVLVLSIDKMLSVIFTIFMIVFMLFFLWECYHSKLIKDEIRKAE